MGAVDAVTGWHISAVRRESHAGPRTAFPMSTHRCTRWREHTRCLHGRRDSGVATCARHAMDDEPARGARRWLLVGNDYIWPRLTGAVARLEARRAGDAATGRDICAPPGHH